MSNPVSRIDSVTERLLFLSKIADFIEQTFKTPRALLSAVELRVRANKLNAPTYLWSGMYVDTTLGVLTEGTGMPKTWKGNCSIYDSNWLALLHKDCPKLFEQMVGYLAIKREFRYLDKAFHQNPSLPRPVLTKLAADYASPLFQSANGIAPGKYGEIGLLVGNRVGPDPISRAVASASAATAYEYASSVDGHADDTTRRGVSRSAEYSLEYAAHIDQGYDPLTFGGISTAPHLWGKYARVAPRAKAMLEPRISEGDSTTLVNYVNEVMPESERLIKMAFSTLQWTDISRYLDENIGDVIKDSVYQNFLSGREKVSLIPNYLSRTKDTAERFVELVVAKGSPQDAYEYCRQAGKPIGCLRTKACGDPEVALNFARYVDTKATPETHKAVLRLASTALDYADKFGGDSELRAVASKDPETALKYALNVDQFPHPVTQEAASYEKYAAGRYSDFVKRYNQKAIVVIEKGDK